MPLAVFIILRLVNILELLILVRCILSWIPGMNNRFKEVVYKITDPFLVPIQNILFKLMGGRGMMIDFSPLILYVLLDVLCILLVRLV